MFDYLAFVYGGISQPSGSPSADGEYLAQKCLDELEKIADKNRFPPRLLILLASPAYLEEQDAGQLLEGIHETFDRAGENIQLIGSSVGGVFFARQFHPKGALLICLASKLIEARIAYGEDARQNPQAAISKLLRELKLDTPGQLDPNPLANKLIFTFLPGCSQAASGRQFYPAPELHRLLYEGVQTRITLIGGVSSANDPSRVASGFQFAHRRVLQDSVVAASVITGVPIGVSLNDGILPTGKILRATKLAADSRTVLEFNGASPREQLGGSGENLMLAKFSADDERIVDIPLLMADDSVQLLRQLETGNYFEVCRRQPASEIFKITHDGIEQAKRRVFVERPVASLLFPCKAYAPRQEQAVLNAEAALSQIEKYLEGGPCVGGFFDGELGVDETGRSRLTNGGVGYVIFGDEIRERTALYKGISSLAEHEPKVLAGSELTFDSVFEAIDSALDIVEETGFPGAMISLVQPNLDRGISESKESIVAYKARGPRFQKIIDHTRRPCDGNDILAVVYRGQQARFIPDSSSPNSCCDKQAIEMSGIISQYVLPLKRLDDTVFATLQVDVGDLRHLSEDDFRLTEKARVLDCFAEVIGASINRIVNAVMNNIMQRLDRALKKSLSDNSLHEGVDKFLKEACDAFGVEMGHLWLAKLDDNTRDPNEQTLILETGFGAHDEAEKESWRKIQCNNDSPICHTFRASEPQIINDVSGDWPWQEMLAGIPRGSELFRSLSPIRSYAAVAFKNENGRPLGAVSFCSARQWFFFGFHRNALEVLAERLGFLVEHLRAKVRLKFLFDVSPRLVERNLDKTRRILQDVTEVFRVALNAKVASLYLWDQDREKYVLRAQSGWKDDRWVHAASYREDAGWIGVQAINEEPLYVTDLRAHYTENTYEHKEPGGRYAEFMFGEPLSETFTVEAIGLPLRIGPKKKNKFGVLTLYRPIEKGWPSGFVTTDIELLQEGAYNAAGLVNAVLRHRDDIWEKDEEKRQQSVYRTITSGDDHDSFEAKVCRQVLLAFRAAEVAFYRMENPDEARGPFWVGGYRRRAGTQEIEKINSPSAEDYELIDETVRTKHNRLIYQVAVRRRQLKEGQRTDPAALKTEGLVEQACIPLIGEKRYLAALVIRWRLSAEKAFLPRVQHNFYQLKKLGRIIGSSYLRNQITMELRRGEKERQQADLALAATNAYAAQRDHILRNTLDLINGQVDAIDNQSTEFEELKAYLADVTHIVNETMDLGERVLYPFYERCRLSSLVSETLRAERALLRRKLEGLNIDHTKFVPVDHMVRVDRCHTKDALFNLINNAADAVIRNMEHGRRQLDKLGISYDDFVPHGRMLRIDPPDAKELYDLVRNPPDATALRKRIEKMLVEPDIEIRVTSADKKAVQLMILDNGIGMTDSERRIALRGYVPGKNHKGVGVLLSRVLLAAQGGDLDLKSEKFKGTRAVLTLPSGETENSDDTAKFDGADGADRG
ncbi:MAG TPA: FIST N-terminal domain-containing protein [Pyrinomonadaceae bacterium]|nr:FIST N-terminal domain-containing protein [Pyrinomonadaceae bacterium]